MPSSSVASTQSPAQGTPWSVVTWCWTCCGSELSPWTWHRGQVWWEKRPRCSAREGLTWRPRVRVPQRCQPLSPPHRWQRLGGSSEEQNQLGFWRERAGNGARSDLPAQEQLPEPSARPRGGKGSPKPARGGWWPQLIAPPDPPVELGRGVGVTRGLGQTLQGNGGLGRDGGVSAVGAGGPQKSPASSPHCNIKETLSWTPSPPPPRCGCHGDEDRGPGRATAPPQPWPGHCCPPPATAHPAPMGAPARLVGASPHRPRPSPPCCRQSGGDPSCPLPYLRPRGHLSPQRTPLTPKDTSRPRSPQ